MSWACRRRVRRPRARPIACEAKATTVSLSGMSKGEAATYGACRRRVAGGSRTWTWCDGQGEGRGGGRRDDERHAELERDEDLRVYAGGAEHGHDHQPPGEDLLEQACGACPGRVMEASRRRGQLLVWPKTLRRQVAHLVDPARLLAARVLRPPRPAAVRVLRPDARHLHPLDRLLARRPPDEPHAHAGQLPPHVLPAVLEEPLDAEVVGRREPVADEADVDGAQKGAVLWVGRGRVSWALCRGRVGRRVPRTRPAASPASAQACSWRGCGRRGSACGGGGSGARTGTTPPRRRRPSRRCRAPCRSSGTCSFGAASSCAPAPCTPRAWTGGSQPAT